METSLFSTSRLTLATVIQINQDHLPVTALIDSGAEQNLISSDLIAKLFIPTQVLQPPLAVAGITGQKLTQI